jgi:hypothetical protein
MTNRKNRKLSGVRNTAQIRSGERQSGMIPLK